MELAKVEDDIRELTDSYLEVEPPVKDSLSAVFSARRARERFCAELNIRTDSHKGTVAHRDNFDYHSAPTEIRVTGELKPILGEGEWVEERPFWNSVNYRHLDFDSPNFYCREITDTEVKSGFRGALVNYDLTDSYQPTWFVSRVAFRAFGSVPFSVILKKVIPDIDFKDGKVDVPFLCWFKRGMDFRTLPEKHWENMRENAQGNNNRLRYVVARHFAGAVDGFVENMGKISGLRSAIRNNFGEADAVEREKTVARHHLTKLLADIHQANVFHGRAVQLGTALGADLLSLGEQITKTEQDSIREKKQNGIDAHIDHLGFVPPRNDWPVVIQLRKVYDSVVSVGSELLK